MRCEPVRHALGNVCKITKEKGADLPSNVVDAVNHEGYSP